MEPPISRLIAQLAPRAVRSTLYFTPTTIRARPSTSRNCLRKGRRAFTTTIQRQVKEQLSQTGDPYKTRNLEDKSYSQAASNLSQDVTTEEKDHFHVIEEESRDKQMKTPWMREGSDAPPVRKNRRAGAMAKGKLLTTPSRMLKIILPLSTNDKNDDRKNVEPLALLVHPQQPLSYLERLIQSELPPLKDTGKIPSITFRAQDITDQDDDGSTKTTRSKDHEEDEKDSEEHQLENAEETVIDGKSTRTGKLNGNNEEGKAKNEPRNGTVHESPDPDHPNFVRWSPSTEIGDFIQDAARAKEFEVDIEGTSRSIYVAVPSFADRTYYLRMRLRKTGRKISQLTDVKRECDELAQRGAKRVAQGGFSALIAWWVGVSYATFFTDLGWDVMEPVTYLVGLSGLIGGYMWFLYHNREASYRSAMNVTVSRRQNKLYQAKGFDLQYWEGLIEEGNKLRKEIKMVADEYDVEWDETHDEGDKKVRQALKKGRKGKDKQKKEEEEDDEEEDEEDDDEGKVKGTKK